MAGYLVDAPAGTTLVALGTFKPGIRSYLYELSLRSDIKLTDWLVNLIKSLAVLKWDDSVEARKARETRSRLFAGSNKSSMDFIPGRKVADTALRLIEHALVSIDLAAPRLSILMNSSLRPIIEALIRAHQRKVKVRIVTEGHAKAEQLKLTDVSYLAAAGIECRQQKDKRLHSRLLITDNDYSLLGSFSFSTTGLIYSEEFAAIVHLDGRKDPLSTFDVIWSQAQPL
jgi:phosphatidylserine/phosphatidylglycerophosphate/cardiolipin synthase-like enzyme